MSPSEKVEEACHFFLVLQGNTKAKGLMFPLLGFINRLKLRVDESFEFGVRVTLD